MKTKYSIERGCPAPCRGCRPHRSLPRAIAAVLIVLLLQAVTPPRIHAQAQAEAQAQPPAAEPVPPPAAPAKLSEAELETLVGPIALYPDPLLAAVLPASVYPLDIVQAARFVKDTNNISKLDSQPWDDTVKAVAHYPPVIQKMNDEIAWTIDLGQAVLNQQTDVMNAVQTLRAKAQTNGNLKTSPEQIVVVTNTIIEKTVEQQVVLVTNTVVQIQPAQPDVVYVPTYSPAVVYAPAPYYPYYPYYAPGYVAAASVVSFGVGMACGAIIANNCDWNGGGFYCGGGDVDVDINNDINIDRDKNTNRERNNNGDRANNGNRANNNGNRANTSNRAGGGKAQKWQPDQNRLRSSGATSKQSLDSRGWSSSQARNNVSTGLSNNRGTSGGAGQNRGSPGGGQNRPTASQGANRSGGSPSRPSSSPSRPSSSSRPSSTPSRSTSSGTAQSRSQGSAFSGGGSRTSERSSSQRGQASRSGGGRSGGGRGGGGRR
jgi:Protein of unknown function (DUF3300)